MRAPIVALFLGALAACTGPWSTAPDAADHDPAGFGRLFTEECVHCHAPDYANTQHPVHSINKFSDRCASCHRSVHTWKDVRFDQHPGFPIDGAHARIACETCHGPQGASGGTACYDCHKDDYDATTAPSHAGAGFSTDCAACHSTNAWRPAHFNHTQFPLSGAHGRYAGQCAACHRVAGDYKRFTCTASECHPAAETNGKHDEVNNYSYDDMKCYSCHPQGKAD